MSKVKSLAAATAGIAALALGVSTASASVLLDENFDELTPQLTATSVGAFSTTGGTNVDIVGGSLFGSLCAAPESGNCVDMDGSNGNPQGVLQSNTTFTLTPGVDYYLSFDLIGSGRGSDASVSVSFGPYSQSFDLTSGDVTGGVISNALITVSSTTLAQLTFTSNTPGDVGLVLDDVQITSSAATGVPEPLTLSLFGAGLAGVGALRRRKKAVA